MPVTSKPFFRIPNVDLLYNFYFIHGYLISTPSGRKSSYTILRLFAKMTGKGGRGGSRIFPELGKVLGCHMPNFRSQGQSLHIDNFCKNQ